MAERVADTTTSLPKEECRDKTDDYRCGSITDLDFLGFEANGRKDQRDRRLLTDREPEITVVIREGADRSAFNGHGNGGHPFFIL